MPEILDLTLRTFVELDRALPPPAVLCSITSRLAITELRATLGPVRHSYLAGLQFFNPVPAMPLVEIIRTIATSGEPLATLKTVVQRLGRRRSAFSVGRATPPASLGNRGDGDHQQLETDEAG